MRFIPAPRLLYAVGALALIALVMLCLGESRAYVSTLMIAAFIGLSLTALLDALLTRYQWRQANVQLARRLPTALALGAKRNIELSLTVQGNQHWDMALFDHLDATLHTEQLPAQFTLHGGQRTQLSYQVTPSERGDVHFAPAALRIRSRWQLLELLTRVGPTEVRRVYPDFAQLARYAWLAGDRRLQAIGIKTHPQRGEGTDFKQLAEYQRGDQIKHVDWKATLRVEKLMVRQFQQERDQAVVFLIDAGRRLRADDSTSHIGGSHFDQALNAVMLLSYVALKQGDAVGAMTFGTPPDAARWFAPRKGSAALNALMSSLYAVQPTLTHSDYVLAARDLLKRLNKRALIVLITNFHDEDAEELGRALQLLRTRHLVLTASLRERAIRELIEQPVDAPHAAFDIGGAHRYEQQRRAAFNTLAARHALSVDTEPDHLGVELVNRYEAIKRAGMI